MKTLFAVFCSSITVLLISILTMNNSYQAHFIIQNKPVSQQKHVTESSWPVVDYQEIKNIEDQLNVKKS